MPRVDGGVVLDAWVCAVPRSLIDLLPQIYSGQGLGDLAIGATNQRPLAVGFHCIHELIRESHGVVRVLTADGVVGLAVEVVIKLEPEPLGQFLLVRCQVLHAFNKRGNLDFFTNLPVDELLDVGVIDIQADHLCSAARGAAGLDCTCGAVADLQEAHQSRAATATGELFVLTTDVGEVGAGARAVLEESRFASPQVHDSAFANQIILHALNEAGVRLWMRVRVLGQTNFASLVIRDPVTLRRAADSVRVVQASVEPLWAVRRSHLIEQHVREFVVESVSVLLGSEVAELLAPVAPATSQAMCHLANAALWSKNGLARGILQRTAVGAKLWHASLAEVLADHDVRGKLTP